MLNVFLCFYPQIFINNTIRNTPSVQSVRRGVKAVQKAYKSVTVDCGKRVNNYCQKIRARTLTLTAAKGRFL